jgi:hypothetical protein
MTLEQFKNGFSCIPIPFMNTVAESFGIENFEYRKIHFRSFSDMLATKVYHHPWRRDIIVQLWEHCWYNEKEIAIRTKLKHHERESTQNRNLYQKR